MLLTISPTSSTLVESFAECLAGRGFSLDNAWNQTSIFSKAEQFVDHVRSHATQPRFPASGHPNEIPGEFQ